MDDREKHKLAKQYAKKNAPDDSLSSMVESISNSGYAMGLENGYYDGLSKGYELCKKEIIKVSGELSKVYISYQELFSAKKTRKGHFEFKGDAFGENGEKYIDGYITVYGKTNEDTIIIQDPHSKRVFIGNNYYDCNGQPMVKVNVKKNRSGVYVLDISGDGLPSHINVYGRADIE